jgi:hypothetical protein
MQVNDSRTGYSVFLNSKSDLCEICYKLPFSTHSLGGRMAFKISSLLGLVSIGGS